MSQAKPASIGAEPAVDATLVPPRQRRLIIGELIAVFAIAVLPYLLSAITSFVREPGPRLSPWFRLVNTLAVAWPVLFIMRRSGRSWSWFGIVRPKLGSDLAMALIFVGWHYLANMVYHWMIVELIDQASWLQSVLEVVPRSPAFTKSPVRGASLGVAVYYLCNGFAEELAMKGYFVPRLLEFSGSPHVAAISSTAMFASYHLYQGSAVVVQIFFVHLPLSYLFINTRRLWPFAVGHGLYDLTLVLGK